MTETKKKVALVKFAFLVHQKQLYRKKKMTKSTKLISISILRVFVCGKNI